MIYLWTALGALAAVVLLVLLTAYICFRMAFYAPRKKKNTSEEFELPPGEIYEPYRDTMVEWMKEARKLPHEEMTVTSFDGLKLFGKYYEYSKGAPIELMLHGYRGNAERDLCGGIQRCFSLGRNALLVDLRSSCKSDGRVISFGINESRDCLTWIDFMIDRFGKDVQIILTGISMGAATVMITAGKKLPENVRFVLADCGYTSAREIIKKTIREMKLPAAPLFPFVKLGAKIFGRFDLEETSPVEAMKKCTIPVIFFHGEADDFVPCEMSRINFEACTAEKSLVTFKGAGHGLSYLADPEAYLEALADFSNKVGVETSVIKK